VCFMADCYESLWQGLPYRFVAKWLEVSVARVPIGYGLCSSSQNLDKGGG
jgi:hypothetical protein